MIQNYFKTSIRNLKRNKTYTFINLIGLSVGIASCLLIFLVVQFETSFDNFYKNKDRIYRVVSVPYKEGIAFNPTSAVPFPVPEALRLDFPHLKNVSSIYNSGGEEISIHSSGNREEKFKDNIYFAEPQFFNLFNFKWLAGNPQMALTEPDEAILTKSIAKKYFGSWQAAIGKSIIYHNNEVLKVTGILQDPPPNTDFPLQVVISYKTLKGDFLSDWVSTTGGENCYILLPAGMKVAQFDSDLKEFVKGHKPQGHQNDGLILQPLNDIHYNSEFGNFSGNTFSQSLITTLSLIGIFLLIIACVNYINLATAQAINRSREVGIRKVLGSNQRQLALEFIGETAVTCILAVLIAVGLAAIMLPFVNNLLHVSLSLNVMSDPFILVFLLSIVIVVTVLSGLYPSLVLSRFNPITALKNKSNAHTWRSIFLRRGLVIFQFTIAQVLIIGMIVVVTQMEYFRNTPMGFDKAAIINVPIPDDSSAYSKIDILRNQLLEQPNIKNVSFCFASPADNHDWNSGFKFDHATNDAGFSARLIWADTGYFKTYDIGLIAGRFYYPNDTVRGFVVNETFLKKLGIQHPEDALGKQISFWNGQLDAPVVGVIRDFHASSLRDPMLPVVMGSWKSGYRQASIKIAPGQIQPVIAFVKNLWEKTYPNQLFQYQFLDQTIANFYTQEDRLSQLYKVFALIAIIISCLGLYGLITFMTVQRTKEVGIRKVLGASASNIIYLFSKEFVALVAIAFLIASPVAYYFMQAWLNNFAFKIHLGIGVFLLAIISSMMLAWFTVSFQAIKASMANPVKSLRSE